MGDTSFNVRQFLSYVWQFYLPKLEFMQPAVGVPWYGFREVYIQSFYSDFAWLEIGYPRFAIDLLQAATMLLLFGLYTVAVTRLAAVRRNWPTIAFLVLTGLSMVAAASRYVVHRPAQQPRRSGVHRPLPVPAAVPTGDRRDRRRRPRCRAGSARSRAARSWRPASCCSLSGLGMALVRFYA